MAEEIKDENDIIDGSDPDPNQPAELWIHEDGTDLYACGRCGRSWILVDSNPEKSDILFCPHCGVRLKSIS